MLNFTKRNIFFDKLEALINSEFNMVKVPIKVAEFARPSFCYDNVSKMISLFGGNLQNGWMVVETGPIMEAIHHAVWETPDGFLIDITPPLLATPEIWFIPDDRITFSPGVIIDNVRLNKSGDSAVQDFITLASMVDLIKVQGIRISENRIRMEDNIMELHSNYNELFGMVGSFVNRDNGREGSQCLCGSGKPYKNCHQPIIRQKLDIDIPKLKKNLVRLPQFAGIVKYY